MSVRSPGYAPAVTGRPIPDTDPPPVVAAPGAPGKDGATIMIGEGEPAEASGKAGDLYLDAETGDLFQKET